MSSKDKDNTLNKLKDFFKKSKSGLSHWLWWKSARQSGVKEKEIGPELEKELRPETPVAQRCKTLKDLGDFVSTSKLEDASIRKLLDLTKDLIVDNKTTEHRHTTLNFYKKLIEGQYANLFNIREHFFLVIQKHDVPEDLGHRLDLLIALTDNGKDITYLREKIGKFMIQWAPSIIENSLTESYLEMWTNMIKFNSEHLDNEIIVGIVQYSCSLCCNTNNSEIGLKCLNILDAVISYTQFPNETLALCVSTLCRTVNNEPYCQASWKNMKMLLVTNLGYASLLIMCNILNDKTFYGDAFLVRGAIFHINMGVFASNSNIHINYKSPLISTVLTSFLRALKSQQLIVTYEVIISIDILVPKYGTELPEHVWDIISEILNCVGKNISSCKPEELSKNLNLQQKFHQTIDKVEEMIKNNEICINPELIYNLIEDLAETRPENSVLNLIEYRSSKVTPARPEWLKVLREFIKRFYKIPSINIRVKTIQSLIKIMDVNRAGYEEEVLERIVIPEFSSIANERDLQIRATVCKALIEFAWHCETKRCGELLDILKKILNRPFEIYKTKGYCFKSDLEFQDVSTVVDGLIDIFLVKLYRLPSCHAIKIFNLLVEHLEMHYEKPMVFEQCSGIRYKIFNWLLKARANKSSQLGYPEPSDGNQVKYSHYLGVDSTLPTQGISYQQQISTQSNPESIPPVNFTKISIRRAFELIVACIEKEKDYSIFQLVLQELPILLQCKSIISGNDIEFLANALFNVYSTKKDRKFYSQNKTNLDELNAAVLPVIASLILYHQFLASNNQQNIIIALQSGFNSKVANTCINTLTVMILEMPESLMRKLGSVLLEMSKMTDTVNVAIPVLEFLSILSRLPNHLFANFAPKDYMYVFAISFPYTKPQRYDHYTVSLAHHVIAGWFLKCKLTFRKNFVNYIISSIDSNSKLLEDNKVNGNRSDYNTLNEDSSNRKRSTSLTERGSKCRSDNSGTEIRPLMNQNLKTFHAELAETCIDFLARHTYSPCSALPKRLPAGEKLFKDGPSQTWLIGQNLITITTTGSSGLPTRSGLCERCDQIDRSGSQGRLEVGGASNSFSTAYSPEINTPQIKAEGPDFRRYTKATLLQYGSGTDSNTSTDLTTSSFLSQQPSPLDVKRQNLTSSSGSLEVLTRRGSNPEENPKGESLTSSEATVNQTSSSTQLSGAQQRLCAKSCTGWAELFVRRPTGNISWIMKIQNPIANDCLGNDLCFNDLISLFLPTQYGGVFGTDFVGNVQHLLTPPTNIDKNPLASISKDKFASQTDRKMEEFLVEKSQTSRTLTRQEELTNTLAGSSSGPIDIPKKNKRHKESGESLSDVEHDDDEKLHGKKTSYEDGDVRYRNPVRRVNSSPEMSSSWRNPFLQANMSKSDELIESNKQIDIDVEQQHLKKKSFTKDLRASCEAIPEEIAGSTPPNILEFLNNEPDEKKNNFRKQSSKNENPQFDDHSQLPPKQYSADDVVHQIKNLTVSKSKPTLEIKVDAKYKKPSSESSAPISPKISEKSTTTKLAFDPSSIGNQSENNGDLFRGRSKTISVVREVNRNAIRNTSSFRPRGAQQPSKTRLEINPSFIFMQLFHTGQLQFTEKPLKLSTENMKAVELLDSIPPFETQKINILYIKAGQQRNELDILKNRYGSVRYTEFLINIGVLINIKEAKEYDLLVNMDENELGPEFTYIWKDDILHITFYVSTLWNVNESNLDEKKKWLESNFVSIVYNESGEDFNLNTITGQKNYACIVVQPLDANTNKVYVKATEEIEGYFCHFQSKIVSDRNTPLLARQMASHANLASKVHQSLSGQNPCPYASNWLERLRKIKNLRAKLLKDQNANEHNESSSTTGSSGSLVVRPNINDFTKYT